MAWTAPRTWSVGEVVTAAQMNQQLRDNLNMLAGADGIGTALPVSPVNGQTFTFTDSTTAPTYYWHLRYNSTTTKWHFMGGVPLFAEVTTSETTTSTTYAALTTAGPSITLPLAGDYDVEVGAKARNDAAVGGSSSFMSYDIGATAAVDADAAEVEVGNTSSGATVSLRRRKSGLTAVTLTAKYRVTGGTGTFARRVMFVTPVKLG